MDLLALLSGEFNATANLVLGGLFYAFWLRDRQAIANLMWAGSHAFAATEVAVWILVGELGGDPLFITGSILAGLAAMLLIAGILSFQNRAVTWGLLGIYGGGCAALVFFAAHLFGIIAALAAARLAHGAGFAWGGALLLRHQTTADTRAVGILFLIRAAQLAVFAPLTLAGYDAAAFVAGHLLALATGFGLLFISFVAYGRHLTAAQVELTARNDALLAREQELLRSNASLADMARRLEEKNMEYAAARDRADSASHAKSQFLATMSHELRTPLNAIIGFSELIAKNWELRKNTSKESEYAGYIRDAGGHLLQIVNDLLDVASIELDSLKPVFEVTSVAELADRAVLLLQNVSTKKRIKIELDIAEDLQISVDFRLMRQALSNIVGNALKFTPAKGSIFIVARQEGDDWVRLSVTDTGPGIDAADREHAFEPFWQKSDAFTRQQGGVGLGLSIVRRIIDAHGGSIRIEGEPGAGATIVMMLPAGRERQAVLASAG